MGNRFEHQQINRGSVIPPHEVWLRNQTFHIKDQFYTLNNRRGGGAFGSVWASTMPNGHRAAVKVFDLRKLRRDINPLALANSFKEEIKMAYKMRDAKYHVVNIYGFDFDSQRHVALMAMELGDHSLEERLKDLRRMYLGHVRSPMIDGDYISALDRKNIWIQLVEILLALHRHNVVHRDIKPANLVFFGPILKIVDLGIAQKEISGYNTPKLGGTMYFSAPECFTGKAPITSKSDIWSLGAILYNLTYGRAPEFLSSQAPFGVPRTRSAFVEDVLNHCLQLNPNERASHHWLTQHPLTVGPAIF